MAVELAAIGRTEEARAASAVALASPLAEVYSEWQETAAEIAEPQSAGVIVTVALPQAEADTPLPRPPLLIQHHIVSPATATTRAAFAYTGAPFKPRACSRPTLLPSLLVLLLTSASFASEPPLVTAACSA